MEWFRHNSSNHNNITVLSFLDKFGHFGPFFYYTFMELCVEKISKKKTEEFTADHCRIILHTPTVTSVMRAKLPRVQRALLHGSSMDQWEFSANNDAICVYFPKLLELLGRDAIRVHTVRALGASGASYITVDNNTLHYKTVEDTQNQITAADKKPLIKENTTKYNSTHNFEVSLKPEVQQFRELIKELGLGSQPTIKKSVVKIAEHFEFVVEDFHSWCTSTINSPTFSKIETKEAQQKYFAVALLSEIGEITRRERK